MDFSNLGPVVALPKPTAQEQQWIDERDARLAAKKAGQGRIGREEVGARCGRAMKRRLPMDLECKNTAREWAVIGGGPSINSQVDTIRKLKRSGVAIVTVNKSHDWALEHGIVPFAHVLLDPKEWVADYVKRPRKDVNYFVSSQCHDSVFDNLKDYPVYLWHAGQDFEGGIVEPTAYLREKHPKRDWRIVPGHTTVGLRVPFLAHHLGADVFHMFGMDSSGVTGMHGYDKPPPPDARPAIYNMPFRGVAYRFKTNSHMIRQLGDFGKILNELREGYDSGKLRKGFKMKFYGSGLLPFYAAMLGLHADPMCNRDPRLVGGYIPDPPRPEITHLPPEMLDFMRSAVIKPGEQPNG